MSASDADRAATDWISSALEYYDSLIDPIAIPLVGKRKGR
jgi:hypothetical protein